MGLNRSRNKNDLAEEESFDSSPGVRCVCTFQSLQGCLSVLCKKKKKKNHQKVISVVVCILVVKVKLFLHLFQINFICFLSLTVPVFHFFLERVLEAEGCRTFVEIQ